MRFDNKNCILPTPIEPQGLPGYIHMDDTDYNNGLRSFIDLNYIPTSNTIVEITMKLSNDSFDAGDTYIFGMNRNTDLWSPSNGYGARIRTNTSPAYYFEPTYGNNFWDSAAEITPQQDFVARFEQISNQSEFNFYFNGTLKIDVSLATLANLSFYLFATNNENDYYNYAHPAEWVKEIKIWEGSTLVRDYLPYIQNNVVGLTDILNINSFYAPTGECRMTYEAN